MGRGPKKHQKVIQLGLHRIDSYRCSLRRITGFCRNSPESTRQKVWSLRYMFNVAASPGPHKGRESLPLILFLRSFHLTPLLTFRNRLKYALNKREVTAILMQRLIKVDGKVRTDSNYPAGFQGILFQIPANGRRHHH
jgi:ribosomal protein S4E